MKFLGVNFRNFHKKTISDIIDEDKTGDVINLYNRIEEINEIIANQTNLKSESIEKVGDKKLADIKKYDINIKKCQNNIKDLQ